MGTGELGRGGQVPRRRAALGVGDAGLGQGVCTRQCCRVYGTGKHGSVPWWQGARRKVQGKARKEAAGRNPLLALID